ncbi:hypothetical protein [Streptomyces sp. YGL11-2]|uniref:hypothetical protein n=1 Tax=Streptomyces sp. YGL11-2 TaxID=3414028 RepID=UPI003CF12C1B
MPPRSVTFHFLLFLSQYSPDSPVPRAHPAGLRVVAGKGGRERHGPGSGGCGA